MGELQWWGCPREDPVWIMRVNKKSCELKEMILLFLLGGEFDSCSQN